MDNKKECRNPHFGIRPTAPNERLVVGARQLNKALRTGKLKQVFLARNADPNITGAIVQTCQRVQIQPIWVSTMAQLGKACGIEVGAAAAALVTELSE